MYSENDFKNICIDKINIFTQNSELIIKKINNSKDLADDLGKKLILIEDFAKKVN